MSLPASRQETAHVLLVGATGWTETVQTAFETRTGFTVQIVSTADDALRVVTSRPIDCVITEYELRDSTGIQLVRSVRAQTDTLPVILYTAEGNETIASKAASAGVSDYLVRSRSSPERVEELVKSAERQFESARQRLDEQKRARQFEAVFHDTRNAEWVLDSDGSLARANQTAREMIDQDVESLVGQPFWTLPWWTHPNGLQTDVQQIIETAATGEVCTAVVTRSPAPDSSQVLELSAYPVHDDQGSIDSIVVIGDDITARQEREHERRTIIQRVTDAVVEVDENWCFTFVDKRAESIYEIDEEDLLGESLWDVFSDALGTRFEDVYREVMDTREPATVVGYNADLDGWFHVEGYPTPRGGVVFYFQDITDRKRHEKRVTGLNEVLGEFMEAESKQDICDIVIEAAQTSLDFPVTAIALYNKEDGALSARAYTSATEEFLDVPAIVDGNDTVGWEAFIENSVRRVRDPTGKANQSDSSSLSEFAVFPLDKHGVLLVGSTATDGFVPADIEFAETIATNLLVALDRAERVSQLQEREESLRETNERLQRLSRINATIRSIDKTLVQASSRSEIEAAVCKQLTASGPYKLAWIGDYEESAKEVTPTEWAGVESGYLQGGTFTTSTSVSEGLIEAAVRSGEPQVVNNLIEAGQVPRRQEALDHGFRSMMSLPLRYAGVFYGVLTLYSGQPGAFDDTEQAVLAELADTIAYAINAVESKKAILGDEVTRLEFSIDSSNLQVAEQARALGCEVTLENLMAVEGSGQRMIFSTRGVAVDAVLQSAPRLPVIDLSLISDYTVEGEPIGLFEATLTDSSLAGTVLEHGGRLTKLDIAGDTAEATIELAADASIREFVEMFRTKYPDSELLTKQTVNRSQQSPKEIRASIIEELTARQLEVLETAYFRGYFEEPRSQSGSEIAATLGISQPTFTTHIRAAQRKVYHHLFEEERLQA